MKFIRLVLIISIMTFVLAIHEGGHAYAMRKRDIPIETFGIGFPVPYLTYEFECRWTPGMKISLSPVLVGAFVRMTDEGLKKVRALPLSDQSAIFGAGIRANLCTFFALAIALIIAFRRPWKFHRADAAILGVGALLFFGNVLNMAAIPIAGIVLAILLLMKRERFVSIVAVFGLTFQRSISMRETVKVIAAISFGVALTNTLPLTPLDGGRIIETYISQFSERASVGFRIAGIVILTSIFMAVIFRELFPRKAPCKQMIS